MTRLFVGVRVPEPLRAALAALRREAPGVRWTAPEALHVTVRFIGEVPEESAAAIADAMSLVAGPRVPLEVTGLGTFGRPPRVFVAHLAPHPALLDLHTRVSEALAAADVPPEPRPFRPHVTLARLRHVGRETVRGLLALPTPTATAPAGEAALFESALTPTGAVHRMVRSVPLSAPTP